MSVRTHDHVATDATGTSARQTVRRATATLRDTREGLRVRRGADVIEQRTRELPPWHLRVLSLLAPRGEGHAPSWARYRACARAAMRRRSPARVAARVAAVAAGRPVSLEALGFDLSAVEDAAPRRPPEEVPDLSGTEELELYALRAGLKPVTFLTLRPDQLEAARALLPPGACVLSLERRVKRGPLDAWDDRRDQGDAVVELYVSRDRSLAERARQLQAEGDPSRAVVELGALLGYPRCCVEAFAAQDDRSNNSLDRHLSAARTEASVWPWELANTHVTVVPFFPCAYTCAAALRFARATLGAMEAARPGWTARLRAWLARPVLYVSQEVQLVLEGTAEGAAVRYDTVAWVTQRHGPEEVTPAERLARIVARGDSLRLQGDVLEVFAGQVCVARMGARLVSLLPFGDTPHKRP